MLRDGFSSNTIFLPKNIITSELKKNKMHIFLNVYIYIYIVLFKKETLLNILLF